MNQEDKQLLVLQDLCARIPYGVIVHVESHDGGVSHNFDNILMGVQKDYAIVMRKNGIITHFPIALGGSVKPYLRSLSSMTPEENKYRYHNFLGFEGNKLQYLDWLNSHHFDYRGLIEKGLAIAVTEYNNPYDL